MTLGSRRPRRLGTGHEGVVLQGFGGGYVQAQVVPVVEDSPAMFWCFWPPQGGEARILFTSYSRWWGRAGAPQASEGVRSVLI